VEQNLDKPWEYMFLSANKMTKHLFLANQLNYVLK
jgi:hypothetical protein